MYKVNKYIIALFSLAIFGCEPIEERVEMPAPGDPSRMAYSVEQNPERVNELWLKSSTPGAIPFWDFETGVSNDANATVLIPFEGDFWIKYYAYSGGIPAVDSVKVSLPQDEEYFDIPVWDLLTNGSEGKTWVWATGNPLNALAGIGPYNPEDWKPFGGFEWWKTTDVEEGKFRLDLNKGFNYTKITPSGTSKGNFSIIETDGITYIRFQGPKMLSQEGDNTKGLYAISIVNEDVLVLNQLYDEAQRTYYFKREGFEGPWETEEKEPDPNFDHGNQTEILTGGETRTWVPAPEVPYNWAGLEGNFLNAWSSRADIVATGWAPYGDADVENIDNVALSFSADGTVSLTQDDGTREEGTFTIEEETNMVTFSGFTPAYSIAGWVTATTTAENQWKIVSVEKSESGEVTGLWFGQRSAEKDEYMVFHFIPAAG